MRVPTIEVKRLDGKLVKINESDRFLYAKMGCDMDPHNLRKKKTSGGELLQETDMTTSTEQPAESTDKPMDETAPTEMKRTMIIQPKPIKPISTPADVQLAELDDLLVN